MSMGTVFFVLVWGAFILFGIIGGFGNIWPFGVLMAVISGVLAIRDYRLKRK